MANPPIACDLTLAEIRERRTGLLPGLLARAVDRRPVHEGYRWCFVSAAGLMWDIAQVIEAERRCCRFLRFGVLAEPDGGPVWLEVTGPEGTREFLDQLVKA
ncbi:MAG TPA: hypothetical protein VGI83_07210 [Gemmatimonadales bacterium]